MRDRRCILWGLSVTLSLASVVEVKAQLVPDNTLGKENSIVIKGKLLERIEGGAIRGSNLFHSFKEFNVGNGKSVYFSNPSAIENILTRVTGGNPSNIFGKLGVLGKANLFLINPNGIIFGENASLDISGSFTATTSPSMLFDNGFEFNASNPQAVPLLKVNLTPGLQYPRHQQGDITSKGNLTVGEDLNLVGRNLDLTGGLNAGRDLNLKAESSLQVRDNSNNAFIADAGRNLLLYGNQTVDIFALNHPNSGLFSGNDLVLQSAFPVLGDARYFSGGSFTIKQLDGSLGNLESPNDPIIRASGDVSFDSYRGASLHILAGGSVNITGDVTITGADSANGLEETVTLANGESLEIDGKTQATLDIRAGTNEFGTPGVTGSGSFTPGNPNTGGSGSSSDIVVGGKIKIDREDGLVFLTNQYQPLTSLSGGDIVIKGDIDTSSILGNGGRIIIDSSGNIEMADDITINSSAISNAGDISINTAGNLEIRSQIRANSSTTNGGNISLSSGGILSLVNGARVISESNHKNPRGNSVTGGDIKLTANSIFLDNSQISASTVDGEAGYIFIDATESINLLNASSITSEATGEGTAGELNITTGEFNITDASAASVNSKQVAGDLLVTADSIILDNQGKLSSETDTGVSGDIKLENLKSLQIKGDSLLSATTRNGEAGDITINASDEVKIESNSKIASGALGTGEAGFLKINTNKLTISDGAQATVNSLDSGDAGVISIKASDVNLTNEGKIVAQTAFGTGGGIFLDGLTTLSLNNSKISASTVNGVAGDIDIKATNSVQLEAVSKLASEAIGNGKAGNINIITNQLKINDNSQANVSSKGNGSAGSVLISANDVSLSNQSEIAANTTQSGTDGNITLNNLKSLELLNSLISASTINGEAGDININATDSVKLSNDSIIASEAKGSGIAGELNIETNQFAIADNSQINVSSKQDGIAGDVLITASDLNLTNQGKIIAQTVSGIGGDITLENLKTLSLSESSLISATTTDGEAGNIAVNATDSIKLENDSRLASEATGDGKAGNIDIITNQLKINDNSQANVSSKGNGSAGSVLISANDVSLANQSEIAAKTTESGTDGNITLNNLKSLELFNSLISASTINGEAGDININATDSVKLSNDSIIASEAKGSGIAGELNIATNQFAIADNSQINVSSKQDGIAGDVLITASDLNLTNQGKIIAQTVSGIGGDITLENLKTLSLSESSLISATTTDGEAGNIAVNATDSIKLETDSRLASEATGDGIAGNINIVTNQLKINDNSQANVSSKGNGIAGDVLITASDLNLTNQGKIIAQTAFGISGGIFLDGLTTLSLNNSEISASTVNGVAGDIDIKATNSVQLEAVSKLASEAIGNGKAGNINIITNQLKINDNSQANVSSKGNGSAGSVLISANDVSVANKSEIAAKTTESGTDGNITLNNLKSLELFNSLISASTINGEAGDININARDSVKLSNDSIIASEAKGSGIAGELNIATNQFAIADSQINVSSKQDGIAGDVLITASDLNLSQKAKISATTESGIGGSITTNDLTTLSLNNSEISATTTDGVAGDIIINAANSIELTGKGGLSVQSTQGGIAGSVTVNTSQFNINDRAQITVSSRSGQAGNLDITADNLFLNQGILTAETGIGENLAGANITLDIKDLLWMQNDSLISAEAFETANGGNITINNSQGFTIGLKFENSDISANATIGNGGNIDITTQNIFGLEFRDRKTSYSDITASSKFGVNGQVTVNQLNVNPASGLIELPSTLIETAKIKAGCAASAGNNFVISGRGGLPQSPNDLFNGNTTLVDLIDLVPTDSAAPSNIKNDLSDVNVDNQKKQIIEATGWVVDADGNINFVAQKPETTSQDSGIDSVSCEDFNNN